MPTTWASRDQGNVQRTNIASSSRRADPVGGGSGGDGPWYCPWMAYVGRRPREERTAATAPRMARPALASLRPALLLPSPEERRRRDGQLGVCGPPSSSSCRVLRRDRSSGAGRRRGEERTREEKDEWRQRLDVLVRLCSGRGCASPVERRRAAAA